jgi:hypothetical protein
MSASKLPELARQSYRLKLGSAVLVSGVSLSLPGFQIPPSGRTILNRVMGEDDAMDEEHSCGFQGCAGEGSSASSRGNVAAKIA